MTDEPLYRQLLGDRFDQLPPVLKDFHSGPRQAEGEFKVTLRQALPCPLIRRVFRIPHVSGLCHGILDVEQTRAGESWTRDIGPWRFKTTQGFVGGLLMERQRHLTFGFRVEATADGMSFQQVSVRWRKLPLFWPFAPRIQADVHASATDWQVSVIIKAPLIGEVMRYEGRLKPL